MKKRFSQFVSPQSLAVVAAATVIGCLGYFGYVIAATSDVTGYACSKNIGCISLNPDTSSQSPGYQGVQPASFGVTYNTLSNEFSGKGWSPVVGTVTFGTTCPPDIQAAHGQSATGGKCARVDNMVTASALEAGGWRGHIYLGGVTLAPNMVNFLGRGWDGSDTDNSGTSPSDVGIGWIDFVAALQGDNGACGTAVTSVATSQPTAGLCAVGTASTPSGGNGAPWTWTCAGSMTTATCATLNPAVGICGTSANTIASSQPSTGLCAVGTASAVSGSNPWNWTCTGTNNNPVACATVNGDTDGVCGSAAWTCSIGFPVNTQSGNGSWTWDCQGYGNGATVSCNSSSSTNPGGPLQPIYKEN